MQDSLGPGECFKTKLSMVLAGSTGPYTTERKVWITQMNQAVVDARSAEPQPGEIKFLHSAVFCIDVQ